MAVRPRSSTAPFLSTANFNVTTGAVLSAAEPEAAAHVVARDTCG